jgi:RNA polymerase sigma-70 factor, ECF subfamily
MPMTNPESFERLFRKYHSRVVELCRYRLGSMEEAEDAAAEIFARLPVALRTYDKEKPFSRWLSQVTNNYCIDVLRRRRSERRIFKETGAAIQEPIAQTKSPLEQLLSQEEQGLMRDAVARLPEHYQRPLVQRYWEELGYHEIARNHGLTRANVATLIFRAKNAVRNTLAMKGFSREQTGWAW